VHDIISSLLHHHTEMSHFHFNESLFKPFESLLLLELCDSDVQVISLFKAINQRWALENAVVKRAPKPPVTEGVGTLTAQVQS
jgi:hypothetical protein